MTQWFEQLTSNLQAADLSQVVFDIDFVLCF